MVTLCNGFISPLDLQCILVNFLGGEWVIFGILAAIFIVSLAATFRMSNILTLASVTLFAVMFYDQMPWFTYMSILLTALVIAIMIIGWVKR